MAGLATAAVAALAACSGWNSARTFVASGSAGAARGGSSLAARRSSAPSATPASRELAAEGGISTLSSAVPIALCAAAAVARRQNSRRQPRTTRPAYASAPQTYEGAPIGPPPDLPSLLLKERIVYLGTPITAEVTELIIAQLLYLNYESADKPITLYINSTGSTIKNNTRYMGESKVGMETDAFAIADCMAYIKPDVQTITIGQAYGTAAVLMGLGAKGKRFALPNATIMLSEPREPPARGPRQASDIRIMAREVLQNRSTMAELLSKATGKTKEQVVEDTNRCYYMTPDEAVTYGLLDKVLTPEKLKSVAQGEVPSFVSAMNS
eukprot:gb/GFBE01077931.1/.p1 GENE.gb/GFBE01077931.1/~~gb/GFBE01077931.1/.p1  ORF type:complete len:325 (+),score=67.96 gb/GFBE01077931.1/:1-975(+)